MSEIEWEDMNKQQACDWAAIDSIYYDICNDNLWWWKGFNEYGWKMIHPKNAHQFSLVSRRKDTPNWIAEKYEAGHELTYLETVYYYILNYNSMSGLEACQPKDSVWIVLGDRNQPAPNRRHRLAKKKPMVIVNGHKVPKWETEPLNDGDTYFLVDLPSDIGYARIKWVDSVSNQAHLENGTVFKNEADIKQFVEAMRDIKEVTE